MTSLVELMRGVDDLDRDGVIHAARPWTRHSDAVCLVDSGGEESPSGLAYLLEVDLIHDVAEVWSSWRDGRAPTADELADAVIHYATRDAYLEPEDPP